MKKTIIGLVVIIALVLIVVFSGGGETSTSVIRIGIIAPLTGTGASYGTEGKNTVVLALDQINDAGGIEGKKIEYFVEDGKCDSKAALDAWNKLVSIDKVTAVFGGHCSTETLAIAPLSVRDHVPVFAVFSNVPVIPNEGEWLFRHVSTNTYYATKLAEQAFKKGHRSIAMLIEVKDLPLTYSEAFAKAFLNLGGKISVDERFDPQTKDYRTNVLKLRGQSYDGVLVSTQGPDVMGLVTNQIQEQGLGKTYLYNIAFSPAKFLEVTGGKMPADYLIVQPYADETSTKVKAFNDAYVAKYGKKYSFGTFFIAADYDIVQRFRDAAASCLKGAGYSTECIRNQFKSATTYSGVAGDVTISDQFSPRSVLTNFGLVKVVGTGQVVEAIQ